MSNTFVIDRSAGKTLVDQLATKIRRAIAAGRYKENDILPSIREMASLAGVSEKVSRGAYRTLAEEGWVETRPHVGSIVSDRADKVSIRGRVLLFNSCSCYCYPEEQLATELRRQLVKKGYRLTMTSIVPTTGTAKYSELEMLLKEKWDLVLEFGEELLSRKLIESAGWPFLIVGNGARIVRSKADNCRGWIDIRCSRALPLFVRRCARKNIHRVVQFLYMSGCFDATEMLKMAGVGIETVRIPRQRDLTSIEKVAFQLTRKMLRSGTLPDVLLYTDDYLARGGLMALAASGVRIPDEVGVVSLVNKGFAPCWPTSLTCLLNDFRQMGRVVGSSINGLLEGRESHLELDIGSEWCEGETF